MTLTNNPNAGVIGRSARLGIPCKIFNREAFYSEKTVINILREAKIDYLILAGFLWLVPPEIIQLYKGRIINIHPALLPDFGGKGFYGERVHETVINSGLPVSGITIHHVNERFDEGGILFQAACHVEKSDDAKSLAGKIHKLEYKYFPVVIEKLIKDRKET